MSPSNKQSLRRLLYWAGWVLLLGGPTLGLNLASGGDSTEVVLGLAVAGQGAVTGISAIVLANVAEDVEP